MITVKSYTSNRKEIWNDFVKNSKNGIFMLNREYMDYHSDRFKDNSLMFYDEDKLIALLPANIKDNILYFHEGLTFGGFITDKNMKQHKMNSCFKILINYCKQNNIEKMIYKCIPQIYHKLPADEDLYSLFLNNAKLVKIEPSTTILLGAQCKMPKGRTAQISRAKREGILIEKSDKFSDFIKLENEVLQEYHNAKAVHTAEELELLYSRFPENIQLWIAKYNEEMIAATLLFVSDQTVHTQYLAANDKAREIGGLDLLIKTLIDKFSAEKKYFDFGISTEDNGKILNEGLISQKEGFGGRTTIYQTWEVNF